MFIFVLFVSLFTGISLLANTEPIANKVSYASGDKLYNWASFLNLRSEPHQDAKILAMVPRGSVLRVAVEQVDARAFSTTLIPDYTPADDPYVSKRGEKLIGNWVKVEYEGFVGFVFDGYLSKLYPMKRSSKKNPGEIFRKYLIQNYRGAVLTEPAANESFDEKVITPEGKLTYTHYFSYACEVFEMDMEGVSEQEALMIMTKMFKIDGVSHREDGKYYLVNKDDPYSQHVVEKTETGARISIWWCEGC